MAEQTEPKPEAPDGATASYFAFAQQAQDAAAVVRQGLGLLVGVLDLPVAVLVREVGSGRVAVVDVLAATAVAVPGHELDVDPGVLLAPVARACLLPDPRPPGAHAAHVGPEPAGPTVGSGLCVQVRVEDQVWGLLGVCAPPGRRYGPADVHLLHGVAGAIATALERQRSQARQRELAAFAHLTGHSFDLTAIIDRAVLVATRLADAPIGAAIRLERYPSTLMVVHAHGAPGLHLGQEYDVDAELAEALRGPGPVAVRDWRVHDRYTTSMLPPEVPAVGALSVALPVEGRAGGRLVVADLRPRTFSAAQQTAVHTVADLLAAALTRDRRRRSDRRLAQGDGRLPRPQEWSTEVALVDCDGVVIWVNRAWEDFCRDNGGDPRRTGVGMSYLEVCEAAHDPVSQQVGAALRHAVRGELPAPMRVRIPCHGPRQERWFDVLISSRTQDDGRCVGATITVSPAPAPAAGSA